MRNFNSKQHELITHVVMDHETSIEQEDYWLKHFFKAVVFFIASIIVLSLFRIFFLYYFSAGLNITSANFLPALGVGIRVDAKWLSLALLPAFLVFLFSINEIRLMISSYLIIFNSPNINELIVNISAY